MTRSTNDAALNIFLAFDFLFVDYCFKEFRLGV